MSIHEKKYDRLTLWISRANTLAQEIMMDDDPALKTLGENILEIADALGTERYMLAQNHGPFVQVPEENFSNYKRDLLKDDRGIWRQFR
jgi:hypothetical protein